MRFNEKEITCFASEPGDKEGRIYYRAPGFRETPKQRWFKLKGNLLFYFRLNEHGAVYETEPIGVLVIEQCRIRTELYSELPNAFSITYVNDLEKRHFFGCETQRQTEDWISILKSCSYEQQRAKLKALQEIIRKKTGMDPLSTFSGLQNNEVKVEENGSDSFFHRVQSPIKSDSEFTSLI